jgi:hypothetical protein
MSVRGEFARAVGDALACLSESDEASARALAAQIEGALGLAREDLEAAAGALIAHWAGSRPDDFALSPLTAGRLAEASERMLAIARVILGR